MVELSTISAIESRDTPFIYLARHADEVLHGSARQSNPLDPVPLSEVEPIEMDIMRLEESS